MKHTLRRCLSIACVTGLLLCMTCITGLAADVEAPEWATDVTYYTPAEVTSVETKDRVFVIHTDIHLPIQAGADSGEGEDQYDNDFNVGEILGYYEKMDFYISFPTEGGFRLRTSEAKNGSGFFHPSGVREIEYVNQNGEIRMTGADGTVLSYTETSTGFVLNILSAQGVVVQTIDSQDIEVGYSATKGVVSTKVSLPLRAEEAIYNGSERFNAVNQVGHSFSLFNLDAAYINSADQNANNADHTNSYNNVPIFHSSDGYSIWYNMSYDGMADVGKTDEEVFSVEFQGDNLDFYAWSGSILENIKKYTAITGTSVLAPEWAFGYWIGATSSAWGDTKNTALQNLQTVFNGYENQLGITDIAAVFGEGQNSSNQDGYDYVESKGSRMLYWYQPRSRVSEMAQYLPGVNQDDYPFTLKEAKPVPGVFGSLTASYYFWDFTHPNAKTAATNLFEKYFGWGLKGAMIDYGEWLEVETVSANGKYGDEMHNLSSYYYAKTMKEVWDAQYPDGDYILFQRSGTAGTQAYVGQFLGDQRRSFSGLKDQLNAMISMGAGGFNIYGGDINGHKGNYGTEELYIRWVQLGTFSPLMRAHGDKLPTPWDWNNDGTVDTNAKTIFPTYYWLRMNLQDALYSASIDAHKNANPMVQAMGVAYQDQKALRTVEDQYLFLNNLLVAPVTEAGTNGTVNRQVVLPTGHWYDLFNGNRVTGGTTVTRQTSLAEMPLYLKSGAALAIELPASMEMMESMDSARYKALAITPPDNLTTNVVYDSEDNVTNYTSRYVTPYLFTVNADTASDRKMVVVYGVDAKSVKVNDVALEEKNAVPNVANGETGYYTDGNLTYIVVADNWSKLTIENNIPTDNAVSVDVDGAVDDQNIVNGTVEGSRKSSTPDENGYYTFNVTVTPDSEYQLKAGSLLFYGNDGSVQVPQNANFRGENGGSNEGVTYTFKTKVDGILAVEFIKPDHTLVNFGCVGTEFTEEKGGGLRFVYRLPRKVENGEHKILLNGKWEKVVDYGLLVAADSLVGNQRLDIELQKTNQHIKKISVMNGGALYDSSDAYADFSVKVVGLKNIKNGTTTKLTANGYVQLEDGTYLYANGYTNTFVGAGGSAAN